MVSDPLDGPERKPTPTSSPSANPHTASASAPADPDACGAAKPGIPLGEPPPYDDMEPRVASGRIPRRLLDEQATFVVRRLQNQGHTAYLVGGCVRDLLAGLEPKDFDVATDAKPNRIKRLFRSARVIGRRFRLVHVRFPGDHVIETATFRGDPRIRELPEPKDADGFGKRDWRASVENIFGTPVEDAWRRDFTVNGLYYDPVRDEVIDWVGGLDDMETGVIRSIGAPAARLCEDPVRMLRAVHFAKRMDFRLEDELESAIRDHADLIDQASSARLYIELVKMLCRGRGRDTFHALHDLGVLAHWLPDFNAALEVEAVWPTRGGGTHEEASKGEPVEDRTVAHATWNLLGAADRFGLWREAEPEALALAVLFAPYLLASWHAEGRQGQGAFFNHMEATFRPLAVRMSIPKAVTARFRDMLWLMLSLERPPRQARRRRKMLFRPSFFEGVKLYELLLASRDADTEPAEAWRAEAEEAGVKPQTRAQQRERRGGSTRDSGSRGRGRRGRGKGGRGGRRRGDATQEGAGSSKPRRKRARRRQVSAEPDAWSPPPPTS